MNKELIREKLIELKENAIFPSREDEDSIEHVDMGYKEVMEILQGAIDLLSPTLGDPL